MIDSTTQALMAIEAKRVLSDDSETLKNQKAALLRLIYVHAFDNSKRLEEWHAVIFPLKRANEIALAATKGITTKLPITRSNPTWAKLFASDRSLFMRLQGQSTVYLK